MTKPTIHPLVERAKKFADRECPDLQFPSDGSSLVRVQPMPAWLQSFAQELMAKTGGYEGIVRLVFRDFSAEIHYVLGFVDHPQPAEHAWIKVGDIHYDPIRELFGTTDCDYLPAFELSPADLNRVMAELGSGFYPVIQDMVGRANWERRLREKNARRRQPGVPHLKLVPPANGDVL